MFKKFTADSVSNTTQVRSSKRREVRRKILDMFPTLEADIDVMFPKAVPMYIAKCRDRINIVLSHGQAWFFNVRDGPYVPTLRLLHRYPDLLPKVRVDRGAVKFVLRGADIMCPGLTSAGGDCSIDVPADTYVAVMAEGKQHALAIGLTKMSTEEIRTVNADIGVINVHALNDGLWQNEPSTR